MIIDNVEQAANQTIIDNVLQKPYKEVKTSLDMSEISDCLLSDDCLAIVVGYGVLELLYGDFEFCCHYEPALHEQDALRSVCGRFMGRLVFSNYSVPKAMFAIMRVKDGELEVSRLVF